ILAQPADNNEVILNYATLAELDSIGQNNAFVDGLISSFLEDNQVLVKKLEELLLMQRFEEFKDVLHAMKGAALSIGAMSLRTMCQRLEKMTHAELANDAEVIAASIQSTCSQLYGALDLYRIQRAKHAAINRT
ncbi:MAG: Hpt domain-containing protein, partial [Burkholderiaceae bacterium]